MSHIYRQHYMFYQNTYPECISSSYIKCYYNNVRISQVPLINLWWEQPHWGEGFLFPMDAFMIHFIFLRVIVALRSSRCEGAITSFPHRINTVLGVTCLSSLTLLAFFAYVHTLVRKKIKNKIKSNSAFNLFFARPTKTMIRIYIL